MMFAKPLLLLLLSAAAAPGPPKPVPCQSVADCWLDRDGNAIARPRRLRGRGLPRGDCGRNILWLSNTLACQDQVCVARHIGNKC